MDGGGSQSFLAFCTPLYLISPVQLRSVERAVSSDSRKCHCNVSVGVWDGSDVEELVCFGGFHCGEAAPQDAS